MSGFVSETPSLDIICHAFEETISNHSAPFENIIAAIQKAFNTTDTPPETETETELIYRECLEYILNSSLNALQDCRTALQKYSGYTKAVETITIENLKKRFGIEIDVVKLNAIISEQLGLVDTNGAKILSAAPPLQETTDDVVLREGV